MDEILKSDAQNVDSMKESESTEVRIFDEKSKMMACQRYVMDVHFANSFTCTVDGSTQINERDGQRLSTAILVVQQQ